MKEKIFTFYCNEFGQLFIESELSQLDSSTLNALLLEPIHIVSLDGSLTLDFTDYFKPLTDSVIKSSVDVFKFVCKNILGKEEGSLMDLEIRSLEGNSEKVNWTL